MADVREGSDDLYEIPLLRFGQHDCIVCTGLGRSGEASHSHIGQVWAILVVAGALAYGNPRAFVIKHMNLYVHGPLFRLVSVAKYSVCLFQNHLTV